MSVGCVAVGGASDTRALQSLHVMDFAPAGKLASDTRLSVPQAPQVASIIRENHTLPADHARTEHG